MTNSHKPTGNLKSSSDKKFNEFDTLQRKLDEFIEAENSTGLAAQDAVYTPDSQHRLDHFVDDLQKQMDAFETSARRQKTAKATAVKLPVESPADTVKQASKKQPEKMNIIKKRPTEVKQNAAVSDSSSPVQAAASARRYSGLLLATGAVIFTTVWFTWPDATVAPPEQLTGEQQLAYEPIPESRQDLATAPVEPVAEPEIKEVVVTMPELTVTADVANVRREGSSSAAVVARLKQGDVVEQTGEQGDWYQIRLSDGSRAWAHHSLFAAESALTANKQASGVEASIPMPALATEVVETKLLTVTVRLGNIRSEPNPGAEVLFRLKKGTQVIALKREGDWLQVRINDTLAWAHHSIF